MSFAEINELKSLRSARRLNEHQEMRLLELEHKFEQIKNNNWEVK
jgi:hypothetical protein